MGYFRLLKFILYIPISRSWIELYRIYLAFLYAMFNFIFHSCSVVTTHRYNGLWLTGVKNKMLYVAKQWKITRLNNKSKFSQLVTESVEMKAKISAT